MGGNPLSNLLKPQKTQMWIAPVVGVVVAAILAAGSLALDHAIEWEDVPIPLFVGDPATARELLSLIATAVATLISLIFTILVVAIQLASSQYSPRVISSLLHDRPSHLTIGIFVGTFTYSVINLLALQVAVGDGGDPISSLSVTIAFVLAVISLATFAIYSNHIIHSVRINSIIDRVAEEARDEIEKRYPDPVGTGKVSEGGSVEGDGDPRSPDGREPSQIVSAPQAGTIAEIDSDKLFELACRTESTLVILPPIGTFVPEGYPLIDVYGGKPDDVLDHIEFSTERSIEKNVEYGFRQLSDIAVRALSPGINDPATAVQVLDRVHDLLRRLVRRELSHGNRYDARGVARVVLRTPSWDDLLLVAVEEVRIYGADSLQATRRLRAMLEDLERIAPPARKPSLTRQLDLLDQAIEREVEDPAAKTLARQPDVHGTGF